MDDFFRALTNDPRIELHVAHLWRGSPRRPWRSQLGTGYSNRYMRLRLGIDWQSLCEAWREKDALYMVGDWAHICCLAVIFVRLLRRAPVALWTDTPQEHIRRPAAKRFIRSALLRFILSRVPVTFTSGSKAAETLKDMGAHADSIVDLQFTVDLDFPAMARGQPALAFNAMALRKMVGCGRSGIVVGMSGTIDFQKKAQDVGLLAFCAAHKRLGGSVGLLVAGAGPESSQLAWLVESQGLQHAVALLGWQEPEQMPAFYEAIDVLLHPAHYDPFPLVVVEALSWSRPVVGTISSGSVHEKVRDGVNGYRVSAGDVMGMAAALERLATDPAHLDQAKQMARQTAEEWPISRSVNIVREECERLLSPTSRAGANHPRA